MSTSPRTELSPSLDKNVSKGSHAAKGGKSEHNTPRGTPTTLTPRKDASSEHDRVFQQLFDLDDDQVGSFLLSFVFCFFFLLICVLNRFYYEECENVD